MSDTSGPTLPEPLAFYDPDSSSWRMSAGTFPWEPPPSLETLPASGMTLDGVLYELPMSVPATAVPGSSSLPTPTTRPSTGNGHARNLGKEIKTLPTPRSQNGEGRNSTVWIRPADQPQNLENALAHVVLLPSPTANQYEMDDVDAYLARRERCKETAQNGNGFGLVLAMAVKMLPTPSAADGLGGHERRGGDRGEELLLAGLAKDVTRLLPTPNTKDGMGARSDEALARAMTKGGCFNLKDVMPRMLPTPTTRDHKSHNQRRDETCLTGALTAPPSPDTPLPSDALPLTLWTDEDD